MVYVVNFHPTQQKLMPTTTAKGFAGQRVSQGGLPYYASFGEGSQLTALRTHVQLRGSYCIIRLYTLR